MLANFHTSHRGSELIAVDVVMAGCQRHPEVPLMPASRSVGDALQGFRHSNAVCCRRCPRLIKLIFSCSSLYNSIVPNTAFWNTLIPNFGCGLKL